MWDLDVRRFGPYASANGFLIPKARDAYLREYAIEFPFEERDVARPLKTGPLYDRHSERGAVWGMRFGWERPQWFEPRQRRAARSTATAAPAGIRAVGEECRAVREAVGVIDQTSFAKFELSGPGAEAYLDRMCANALPKKVGRIALTQMCTPLGGIECDVTVTRLADERWYVVSAAATEHHDEAWLEAHLPGDGSVRLDNVSARYGVLTLAGPALARADDRGDRRRLLARGIPVLQQPRPAGGLGAGARDARLLRRRAGLRAAPPDRVPAPHLRSAARGRRAAWARRLRLQRARVDAAGEGIPALGPGHVDRVQPARGGHGALGALRQGRLHRARGAGPRARERRPAAAARLSHRGRRRAPTPTATSRSWRATS